MTLTIKMRKELVDLAHALHQHLLEAFIRGQGYQCIDDYENDQFCEEKGLTALMQQYQQLYDQFRAIEQQMEELKEKMKEKVGVRYTPSYTEPDGVIAQLRRAYDWKPEEPEKLRLFYEVATFHILAARTADELTAACQRLSNILDQLAEPEKLPEASGVPLKTLKNLLSQLQKACEEKDKKAKRKGTKKCTKQTTS